MILATGWVDKLKIDDPVGAVAVHGVNGMFGTIAVGLFDIKQGLFTTGHIYLLAVQVLGAVIVSVWGFSTAWGVGTLIKTTMGIRVSKTQEEDGLDITAHGIPAYNELERFSDSNPFVFTTENLNESM